MHLPFLLQHFLQKRGKDHHFCLWWFLRGRWPWHYAARRALSSLQDSLIASRVPPLMFLGVILWEPNKTGHWRSKIKILLDRTLHVTFMQNVYVYMYMYLDLCMYLYLNRYVYSFIYLYHYIYIYIRWWSNSCTSCHHFCGCVQFAEAFCWDVASTFLSDMSRLACDAFAAPVLCQLLQLPTLQQELRRKLVAGLKGQGVVEVLVGIPY